jgi:hypothetical protein
MPNWCYNHVTFSGDKENLNALNKALTNAEKAEQEEKQAQKIHSLDEVKEGYFFDIYHEQHDDHITLQYETRWSPNQEDLALLCKEYKVSAEHEYSESGMQIYGTATYDASGEYTDEQVSQEFLDLIEYDDESGMYLYEGEYWESEDDLIETEYPNWKEKNL